MNEYLSAISKLGKEATLSDAESATDGFADNTELLLNLNRGETPVVDIPSHPPRMTESASIDIKKTTYDESAEYLKPHNIVVRRFRLLKVKDVY